jgi:crotonobetainyl-CoA:carnitine CoA-transferase CaiB-like acyl-CoA transferase
MGSAHPLNGPYQAFESRDGWINVGASNQKMYPQLVELLGVPELATDPRFRTGRDRMNNLAALIALLTPHFKKRPTSEWLVDLERLGIPCGPVLSIGEMHEHPQTLARDMVPSVNHPTAGEVRTIGLPVKFSETPGAVVSPAPLFGQHTREVLAEAGFAAAEIEALFSEDAAKEPVKRMAAE